jgi:glycerophosphoryl diester phosphodiesterase
MSDRFLIFGHRGSPKKFPENTLASFDEALRVGADGFETDLRLLSDHTAVLYHDDEFADEDVESLSALNLAERGAVIQRLADLAPYAEKTRMILEVKRAKWEDTLLEQIANWSNVVIASFDHSSIRELHRRGVAFPLGLTYYGHIVDAGAYASRIGASWCFPNYHYVDQEMVESLHEHGVRIAPWTPNRPREWQRLREVGCDGIITDLPGEAVQWRDTSGR